jgi:hypothetical protein
VREEESAEGDIKLVSISALDTLDSTFKLCGHICKEVREGDESVGLMA